MELGGYLLVALASVGAGAINAAAGGGTLITFPAMLAAGMPPIAANITSSIGLVAGSLGGAWSYRRELQTQRRRFWSIAPFAAIGGVAGALLLMFTPSDSFTVVVPWLVLIAAVLFAVQPLLQRWLRGQDADVEPDSTGGWPPRIALVFVGVYGAYFGAGIGVMMLAVLGICIHDSLQRHNALKNILALTINGIAVVLLAFSPHVDWLVVAIMLPASLLGGFLGGALGRVIPSWLLRVVVIGFALTVAIALLARQLAG